MPTACAPVQELTLAHPEAQLLPALQHIYAGHRTQTLTTGLRSSIAGGARAGTGFLIPRSPRMIAVLEAAEESRTQTTYRHVFQFLRALEEQNPDDPTVHGVLDAAREDVVQFLGEHTLRTALVDPADIVVRLTRLNTPNSALLHTVWYNDHPDLFQDRIIPLLTED